MAAANTTTTKDHLQVELREVRQELDALVGRRNAEGSLPYAEELRYQQLCLRERQLIIAAA